MGFDEKIISISNDPILINFNLTKIKKIKTGYQYSIILTDNNEIYAFGDNSNGIFGNMEIKKSYIPILINISNLIDLKSSKIKNLCCGSSHVLLFTEDNILIFWGKYSNNFLKPKIINNEGVLKNKKIKKISCGSFHSLVLLESNEIFAFGNNFLNFFYFF
jgi:alpha-tubulin suppressor-like RCC1 family protein